MRIPTILKSFCSLVFLAALLRGQTPPGAAAGVGDDLVGEVAALAESPLEELWPRVKAIREHAGAENNSKLEPLVGALPKLKERARLAGAAILLDASAESLSEQGQLALEDLARKGRDKTVRVAAIRLLRDPAPALWEAAYLVLKGIVDTSRDPIIRIEASVSLWELENYPPTRQPIRRLLEHEKLAVRYAAALALARTGDWAPPVRAILETLRNEPTERGQQAELLLQSRRKAGAGRGPGRRSSSAPAAGDGGGKLEAPALGNWLSAMDEIVRTIREKSIYRDTTTLRALCVAALRGMASSLDPYSAFLDVEDFRELEVGQIGTHLGLGAQILKPARDEPLIVINVRRGGPAHAAGLRSGDRILEINGVPAKTVTLETIRRLTGGGPGTRIHLLARPWSGGGPRRVTVKRGELETPSVEGQILPDGIGYVRILRFATGTARETEALLDRFEARGLNALILDLRDNPGGKLEEAVKLVDLFVPEEPHPIISERGSQGTKEWFPSAGARPPHPTFALVNGRTVSSAEVVAGALQDFRKATIVGQPTFGKGLKQTAFPLSPALDQLLGGEGRLLLTTSRLYLPLGRAIQPRAADQDRSGAAERAGIFPDIRAGKVHRKLDKAERARRLRLEFSPRIGEFLARHDTRIREILSRKEHWDPAGERDFAELAASLQEPMEKAELAEIVRTAAVRRFDEEKAGGFTVDFHGDPVLSAAILHALRRLGRNPEEVPAYRDLPEHLDAAAAR